MMLRSYKQVPIREILKEEYNKEYNFINPQGEE